MSSGLFRRLDQSFRLNKEELAVVELVRQVVREKIEPRAEQYDLSAEFPWDNLAALNTLELNSVFIPPEYGGFGLSYACFLRIVKEISRGCPATAITWSATYHAISPLIEFGTEDQKRRHLPAIAAGGLAALAITEESGGSDVGALTSSLDPENGEVVLNGSKVFITNGDVANLYLVFAKWSKTSNPRDALTAVIVDKNTPGLEVGRKEDKLGYRASSTVALSFRDCRVPAENVLGEPGYGFRILVSALNRSRPSVSAQALGIAHAAFDEIVKYGNMRRQFGRRILEFQGVQFMVADMATKLALAEAWLVYVADMVDRSTDDYDIAASMLKVAASDAAMEIATNAVQLHGGYGYIRGAPVERLFRDAKLTQIWEGANELHRHRIGRSFVDRG